MFLLFYLALKTEQGHPLLKRLSNHPLTYASALEIYCTTWTYYGSVGKAATNGMTFLTIYLGPTLITFFWWFLLRKLIRIKQTYHITSIADFICARYNKSQGLAALVTIITLIGVVL